MIYQVISGSDIPGRQLAASATVSRHWPTEMIKNLLVLVTAHFDPQAFPRRTQTTKVPAQWAGKLGNRMLWNDRGFEPPWQSCSYQTKFLALVLFATSNR